MKDIFRFNRLAAAFLKDASANKTKTGHLKDVFA